MNATSFFLQKGFLLFLLFSPGMLVRLARETQAEPGNELNQREEDSSETGVKEQYLDGFNVIMQKLYSFDQFMTQINETVNDLTAFLPLLQQLNTERLERLENERMEREKLKGEMMRSPRAKLYTGTNFTGNFENYDFQSALQGKGCQRLQNYAGKIKSIDTQGTCVRLFQHCMCSHWSQAFYPGIDGNAIDSKLEGVECIGPCSPNELEVAEIKGSSPNLMVHKPEKGVPDLIADYWTWNNKTYLTSSLTSIYGYSLGVGNRLEGVLAGIYPRHLRSSEEAERLREAGRNFTESRFHLNEDGVEVGFAIPIELGGPSDELYNVFLQDKTGSVKYREVLVPICKQFLQANPGSFARLGLSFIYKSSAITKPSGIWYRYYFPGSGPITGYLFN